MLEVKGISAAYGQHPALKGASVRVGKGEIVVILGANGAGKSTLLKAISGICEGKVTGSITMNGHELVGMKPDRIVEEGIALVPEGRGIFGDLTVEENLTLGAYAQRAKDAEEVNLDRVYTLFPKLRERRRQVARTMSGGEQQMVAIGRAMMSNPAVLTLDEPSLGLSPLLSKELFSSLRAVRDTGIGILLVEQNAKASLAIADRGYLLENTQVVHEDTAANLAKDPAVQKAYLGGAAAKPGAGKGMPAPAPSAPRPAKGPSPSEIAAQAMARMAPPAKPAAAPAPTPTPQPEPRAHPPQRAVSQPAPVPPARIDTADLVARASQMASRRGQPPAAPKPGPMPAPTKPARAASPPRPVMPDLTGQSDRLRDMLQEIETAAARARDRSRNRTRQP
ncbi:ATP-binding cassette domain-containing protein [Mesobacterium pallidum]|uniref:ATP-binding cassette domain-containing protein n=1 Tax=Mesobacterium pallidum TaxID=2872037 RepID=UPI002342C849|nr:ATP-binding cassette domain-containing protein [Mesobacterium pallidum]